MTFILECLGDMVLILLALAGVCTADFILWNLFKLVKRPEFGPWALVALEVLAFDQDLKAAGWPAGITLLSGFIAWHIWGFGDDWRKARLERIASKKAG